MVNRKILFTLAVTTILLILPTTTLAHYLRVPIITSNSSTNEDRQNNRNVINEKTIGWKEPTKLEINEISKRANFKLDEETKMKASQQFELGKEECGFTVQIPNFLATNATVYVVLKRYLYYRPGFKYDVIKPNKTILTPALKAYFLLPGSVTEGAVWFKTYVVLPKVRSEWLKLSYSAVKFIPCKRFSRMSGGQLERGIPGFESLKCDFEDARKCHWVALQSDESFERVRSAECLWRREHTKWISSGMQVDQKDDTQWFAASMTSPSLVMSSFLLSPLMRRSSDTVEVSFYHAVTPGSGLVVRVVGEYFEDVEDSLAHTVVNRSSSVKVEEDNWVFARVQVEVPSDFDSFHSYERAKAKAFIRDCEPSTVAAIDDIVVNFKQPSCSTEKEGSTFLDCHFTAKISDDGETGKDDLTDAICNWTGSHGRWTMTNKQTNEYDYWDGVNTEQLEGRGDVLSFVPAQGVGRLGNTLWSPYLVANSNCSCVMTFQYFIDGTDTPRLTVVIRYRDSVETVRSLWESEAHVNVPVGEWRKARVNLGISEGDFRLELHVGDVADAKTDYVNLDDFKFEGCDFSPATVGEE